MLQSAEMTAKLLSPSDPEPVALINAGGVSPFVLSCEHAGRAIPEKLGDLGISSTEMDRHIAYDIGAEGLSMRLSNLLDAPLIVQRYSRLVIDCNRPLEAPDCMPKVSDGTVVPVNAGLTDEVRFRRFSEIHQPFHQALARLLDRRRERGIPTVLIAVHSFTPQLLGGPVRQWEIGALSNRDSRFALRFLDVLRMAHPSVVAAHNQPYFVDDASDYTIPIHGEQRGLPHLLLEIRNDLIERSEQQTHWARLIANMLVAAYSKDNVDGR